MFISSLSQSLLRTIVIILLGSAIISGCGDSTSATEQALKSDLYVSLTDAEGDFTQYTVDVQALKLYRANGAVIETLPNTTTLDFAQYIDVTEFLTTSSVPVGYYTKAEITLDFSASVLEVENEEGNSIPATALDENNEPLTTITLSTLINSGQGFAIRVGVPASLTLDFDLEASNQVEIAENGESATVTVNPVLVANTSIDDEKDRRVRGLLKSVDVNNETFVVDIRPFRIRHHSYGNIKVHTDQETVYEIDGVSYDQMDGLRALNALDRLSPIVVLGTFHHADRLFQADEVYAGSSVPWNDKDILKGSIIARVENTLTVLGATIELDDGHFSFNDQVTVEIDNTTRVTKQGSDQAVTIQDLSIGQRVLILGDMIDEDTMDAASRGLVRMRYSDISGKVFTVSPLELDLQHVNRRNVRRYDFTGTGSNGENDANPSQYQVDTHTLGLDSLQQDAPVWVRGFPTPFGSAPMDFSAKTVIDVSKVQTKMYMSYGKQGSPMAVASLDEQGLLLDLDSTIGRHHLKQAGIITDIHDLTSVPYILPQDGRALYAISQGRTVDVFTRWDGFQASLSGLLENDSRVVFVYSKGEYDSNNLSLNSRHVVVRLSD
jgi:hypothetical protein